MFWMNYLEYKFLKLDITILTLVYFQRLTKSLILAHHEEGGTYLEIENETEFCNKNNTVTFKREECVLTVSK